MSEIIVIISLTLLFLIYVYFKYSYTYWKSRNVPQISPSFPFGDMASVIFRQQNMGDKIKEIYDAMKQQRHKFVGLYFFSRKAFMPLDPVLIKHILSQDFQHFNDRGIYYDEENDPISAHLFSLSGTKWKNLRTKLSPAYSPGKLKYMFNTIRECGFQMATILTEIVSEHDQVIEIKEILARYTTDVIGSCAFGIECNSMRNPKAEFRLMGKRAFTQTISDALKMIVIRSCPSLAKLLRFGVFPPTVTKFFQNVVKDTIEFRENNNVIRRDFLQLLIQLKNNGKLDGDNNHDQSSIEMALTMDEAASQAFIFFLAGFETTSTAISFALFEMALNRDVQAKARSEVVRVLDKYDGTLCYEAVMELGYLEMVILEINMPIVVGSVKEAKDTVKCVQFHETMRKYPPAPVYLRKCTKTYQVPDTNVIIEKGLSVLIPAYGLHRDPEYFPNPEKFDPERFSKENKSKIWDYTYIPFGDGPRICIGMRFAMIQIKIAMSVILNNFQFDLNKKTILPLKMETKGITLAPIGGIWLNLNKII